MKKLRWGVLSTAKIGRTQVIPAIQRSTNGEVYGIASRGEKAKEVAEELNIPNAYTSYEALLEDPEIEAVYIPLPNGLHKEWVMKAAEHGKHILCEKPAALNVAELEEMLAACKKNDVTFMEAFMYQFHPQHNKVKELINAGKIGDLSFMRASFSFLLKDNENIRMDDALGGGSLYDIGCYTLHSILHILEEEPTKVFANATLHPEFKVDMTAAGVLSFASGVQASFDSSFASTFRQNYQVVGSNGVIDVIDAYRPDKNEDGEGIVRVTNENGDVEEFAVKGDQYKLQVEHFSDCILHDKQPIYTKEKILAHMKLLDACYQSIGE